MKALNLASSVILLASLLFTSHAAAQAVPAGGGGGRTVIQDRSQWEVFGGGSYLYNMQGSVSNMYGWDMGVSQYNLKSLPWLGGTIDVSGTYKTQGGLHYQTYALMGGPSVAARSGGIHPFARVLLGGIFERDSSASTIIVPTTTVTHFGASGGAGFDIPLSSHISFRTQADWLSYWQQTGRQDAARGSAGMVVRF